MFLFQKEQEPPIHQAVIEGRCDELINLSQQQNLLYQKNSLGFTSLELAYLLDRKECYRILSAAGPRKIQILPRGEKICKRCHEDEFEELFGVHYLTHLKFSSYESLKEVIRECPYILKNTYLGEENRALGEQFQKEVAAGQVADVTIQWINSTIGYGVFANKNILAGSFIGEYTGLVRRLRRFHPDHNAYCFHYPTRLFSLKYFIIDAINDGNVLRFVNHSDHPNLKPACLVDRGLLHIVLFANKSILKGSELTFNYGSDYWRSRQKAAEQ